MNNEVDIDNEKKCIDQLISFNEVRKIKKSELEVNTNFFVGEGKQALVRQGKLDKKDKVAVKIIKDIDYKLFEHELLIVANLNHPNIPILRGVVLENNMIELVFEFIYGQTLEDYDLSSIKDQDKIKFVKNIADALQCLYKENIVHRDLNPKNIMIDDVKGKAYLIDFGVAKALGSTIMKSRLKGTLSYLPPETFDEIDLTSSVEIEKRLISVNHKSDIWSFGCIISYLFSGWSPWSNKCGNKESLLTRCLIKKKAFPIPDNISDKKIINLIHRATEVGLDKRADIHELCRLLEEM